MKTKILFVSLLVAVGFIGCTFEEDFGVERNVIDGDMLTAVISDYGNLGTRSVLLDNHKDRVDMKWEEGDKISVFGSVERKNTMYIIGESGVSRNGKNAVFWNSSPQEPRPKGDLTACYPYNYYTLNEDGSILMSSPRYQNRIEENGAARINPEANMMVAHVKEGVTELKFQPLFAILKIGLIAESDEPQTVNKVQFEDVSGKAVGGNFTVKWENGKPVAVFPETPNPNNYSYGNIESNMKEGVSLRKSSISYFYFIIPARNYEQGFRLTFYLKEGGKIVKTIGKNGGKVIEAGGVYPVGTQFPKVENVTYELQPKVNVADDDRVSLVQSAKLEVGVDNKERLTLTAEKGFNAEKGEIILINQSSETLPRGFVGRVLTIEEMPDGSQKVVMERERDLTKIFYNLEIGSGPIWNDNDENDMTANEEGGVELDLNSHLESVRVVGEDEESTVTFNGSTIPQMGTRAVKFTPTFAFGVSYTLKDKKPNDEDKAYNLSVGLNVEQKNLFAVSIVDGEFRYIHFKGDLSGDFSYTVQLNLWGVKWEKETPKLELKFTPILAGPFVIWPEIHANALIKASGDLYFTSALKYAFDFDYGCSYNRGGGFTVRWNKGKDPKQEGDNSPLSTETKIQLEGKVGMGANTFLVLDFCNFEVGVGAEILPVVFTASLNLNFEDAVGDASLYQGLKGSGLSAAMEVTPKGMVDAWVIEKEFDLPSISFPPYWERYAVPDITSLTSTVVDNGDSVLVEATVKNKLITNLQLFVHIYKQETAYETFKTYVNLGTYSGPPEGEDERTYKVKFPVTSEDQRPEKNLEPGKYKAKFYVSLLGLSIDSGVESDFIITAKPFAKVSGDWSKDNYKLSIEGSGLWCDFNGNGFMDEGENTWGYFSGGSSQSLIPKEAAATFKIYGTNISSFEAVNMTSVELYDMPDLTYLSIGGVEHLSWDLSKYPKLETLVCQELNLSSLDVSSNTELINLSCNNNQLTRLDVGSLKKLKDLTCSNNNLSTLSGVNGKENLENLNCYNNNLTSLDVNGSGNLSYIGCSKNKLTTINISGLPNLKEIDANENSLSTITGVEQISSYKELSMVRLEHNKLGAEVISTIIRSLPDRNGLTTKGYFYIGYNPGLYIYNEFGMLLGRSSAEFQQLLPFNLAEAKNWYYYHDVPW